MTYLGTASFVTYLIPFLFLYNYDKRRHTDDEPVPWYERLGFRLPPMYPASELPDAKPRTGASLEHSLPSLQAKRPQFPSSIDGRRPRSNLNMRVEVTESAQGRSHPKSYRGRSTTVRNLEECQDLLRTAAPTYVSESQSDLSDANMQVVLASELPPLSIQETAVLAMQFAVVWFAANWSFVAALGYTSVASGTTLGSSSGFFTLLLGGLAGIDSFSPAKLASVFLRYVVNSCSFFGVSLVAWADSGAAHPTGIASHPVLGDSLAIISAMCYAAYVTLLKLRIGSEDRISMPLFLGFVGLFNLVAFWPVGLLLDVLGVEPLELPSDGLMLMGLILNMAITVIRYVQTSPQRFCVFVGHAQIVASFHDRGSVTDHTHGCPRRRYARPEFYSYAKWYWKHPSLGRSSTNPDEFRCDCVGRKLDRIIYAAPLHR